MQMSMVFFCSKGEIRHYLYMLLERLQLVIFFETLYMVLVKQCAGLKGKIEC